MYFQADVILKRKEYYWSYAKYFASKMSLLQNIQAVPFKYKFIIFTPKPLFSVVP